ncbi:MAG: TolB family protein, partial [Polyangiales bacterium]
MNRILRLGIGPIAIGIGAWAAACGSADGGSDDDLRGQNDGGTDADGSTTDAIDETPVGPFDDFSGSPIVDMGAPASSPTLFGPSGSGKSPGGPCLTEPQDGSLIPLNFLRQRFHFIAPAGHNLFEIRLSTKAEKGELVVYTTSSTWTVPADLWKALNTHAVDTQIDVVVRSGVYDASSGKLTDGPYIGSIGSFTIAPAEAAGSIVYWVAAGATDTRLKGFHIGEETVHDVLDPSKISGSKCVGCHASTPDGKFVALSSSEKSDDGSGPAHIEIRGVEDPSATPSFLTPSATSLLGRLDQHSVSFSKAHWSMGDHVILTGLPIAGKTEIVWTDLEATSTDQDKGWGVLARDTDTGAAGGAAFSHDGKSVLYFSAPTIGAGLIDGAGQSDLFIVPYGDRKGGTAKKLYTDGAWSSYYPQFSSDDALIAFNRVPRGQTSYNNAAAEISVISPSGGSPTRLVANDPPACAGTKSPGITNSWPKWAPVASPVGSKTYYWLTFSS